MVENDRRRYQRMKLAKPIMANVGTQSALILDIGMAGAFVEHFGEARPGDQLKIAFRWQGEEVAFVTQVNRSEIIRPPDEDRNLPVSQTGLEFVEAIGDSDDRLQDMMATFVGRILAAQKANATGSNHGDGALLNQIGQARRSRTSGFLAYLWNGKSWTVRRTKLTDQPRLGFTVPAYEDEEDLETLCQAYERADEDGRNLIRLVAELSINDAKG